MRLGMYVFIFDYLLYFFEFVSEAIFRPLSFSNSDDSDDEIIYGL